MSSSLFAHKIAVIVR